MLNIMHLTFDMGIGGTEQVIRQLILGLDPKRFTQQICCLEEEVGAMGQQLQNNGIRVHALARQPGFDLSLIKKLRELIQVERIDVIHCHQYTPWVYGWLAACGLHPKVVFTEHGRFFPDRYRWKAWAINKAMAASTAKITAISAATKAALEQFEFINSKHIEVIYNGIEAIQSSEQAKQQVKNELGISAEHNVIGTVARLDSIKNQAMMIQAFAMLRDTHSQLRLLIVGDGPEMNTLRALTQQLNVVDYVIFAGFKSPAIDYMAIIELFLLPSLSEGTSMTLLEAMSLGIPCIVSDAGGNAEVIAHNLNGLVLTENTAAHLAKAIEYYLTNKQALIDAGTQARLRFEQLFSAKQMVSAFTEIYHLSVKQ
ncbi:MAG: glycosyltransferase family 4 protein [Paraglaciecola sp.]|nr:glycosyltransferase family 4 protein [Paraglaciecola sp.]